MYKNKKIEAIGIIITLILLILLVIFTNATNIKFSSFQKGLDIIVIPIQNGIEYLKNKIAKNSTFFDNIENLKLENEELKIKNEELKEKLIKLELLSAENKTLRAYSEILNNYSEYKGIPATIINKNISNLSDTIIINVGSKDGIKENMAVIALGGLVGKIVSVTDKTAKVQTIVDSSSSASATISTTKESVMAKGILGDIKNLKLTYIPTEAQINLGEEVETSGMGGIYPKGLLIGKITEIIEAKNITDRYALIETAVNFSNLETVLVIEY